MYFPVRVTQQAGGVSSSEGMTTSSHRTSGGDGPAGEQAQVESSGKDKLRRGADDADTAEAAAMTRWTTLSEDALNAELSALRCVSPRGVGSENANGGGVAEDEA
jgi:hypothetical protein